MYVYCICFVQLFLSHNILYIYVQYNKHNKKKLLNFFKLTVTFFIIFFLPIIHWILNDKYVLNCRMFLIIHQIFLTVHSLHKLHSTQSSPNHKHAYLQAKLQFVPCTIVHLHICTCWEINKYLRSARRDRVRRGFSWLVFKNLKKFLCFCIF